MGLVLLIVLGLLVGFVADRSAPPASAPLPRIEYRDSTAIGRPDSGRLEDGVLLPREGRDHFTWDPARRSSPNRPGRRWATDDTIRTTLRVLREFRRDHPGIARVGIGDLSLPEGGYFGEEINPGYPHDSHQNGLDVDVYYPTRSGQERATRRVHEVDVRLAQDLVDRFAAAGAVYVFVGPALPLTGPAPVVVPLVDHDDHMHVRFDP